MYHADTIINAADEHYRKLYEDDAEEEAEELREKLSHLMDVAGKMAKTLNDIASGEVSLEMLDEMTREDWCCKWASEALAEWDGIK